MVLSVLQWDPMNTFGNLNYDLIIIKKPSHLVYGIVLEVGNSASRMSGQLSLRVRYKN